MNEIYSMFDDQKISSSVFGASEVNEKVIRTLTRLYELTDWRSAICGEEIEREYNKISTISICKALALPYVLNIASERALREVVIAHPDLQILCGFYPDNLPEKRTFWHFRNKYKDTYSNLLLKVLICLFLSGIEQELALPFAKGTKYMDAKPSNDLIELPIYKYGPKIFIHQRKVPDISLVGDDEYKIWLEGWKEELRKCENIIEYEKLVEQHNKELLIFRRKHASGFLQELTLPIDIIAELPEKVLKFQIVSPSWFDETQKAIFSVKGSKIPYTNACNVIVLRGDKEILLSQRIEKGYGQGEYAIPGGKQKKGESLEACANRELMEETQLRILKSRPVSLYNNPNPNDPSQKIQTVGVLVEEWKGELATAEIDRHVKWEWYDIENLPEPLFEPTKIAIDQYLDNTYPNLTWQDVEKKREEQLSFFDLKKNR